MRISIITVCLNPGKLLSRTITSIESQQYNNLQWVVVDGGSTDGTLSLINASSRKPNRMVSEPDRGIADAFNKGIRLADGEAIIFMNAGDQFASPDCLHQMVECWQRPHHRWIMGAADIMTEDGSLLFTRGYSHTPKNPMSFVRYNCQIMHQAVLAERSLFEEFGLFDEQWRIAMDYDLWVRWLSKKIYPQCTLIKVCRFYRGGVSGNPVRNIREEITVRAHNGVSNYFFVDWTILLLARLKYLIRGRYGKWLYRLKERLGIRI